LRLPGGESRDAVRRSQLLGCAENRAAPVRRLPGSETRPKWVSTVASKSATSAAQTATEPRSSRCAPRAIAARKPVLLLPAIQINVRAAWPLPGNGVRY